MNRIGSVDGGAKIAARPKPEAAPGGGFNVAEGLATEDVRQSQATPPAALSGFLALQEAETDMARNKQGRRHGLAMLDALRELQKEMLGTGHQPAGLDRLAGLSRQAAMVADAGLEELLAAIRLRAKIELLRRGGQAE